uniref:Uncharacterized protein n=1 Tax=Spironucleus salmonicida TaxID=348837 RepID=V6LV17_9EUKA|eukprot:EST44649.1 Hypothetical protein SS50377_15658 [Spironucleus salmonicida]
MLSDDCTKLCMKTCVIVNDQSVCPGNLTWTTLVYIIAGGVMAVCLPLVVYNIYCSMKHRAGYVRLQTSGPFFRYVTMDEIERLRGENVPLVQSQRPAPRSAASTSSDPEVPQETRAVQKEPVSLKSLQKHKRHVQVRVQPTSPANNE